MYVKLVLIVLLLSELSNLLRVLIKYQTVCTYVLGI